MAEMTEVAAGATFTGTADERYFYEMHARIEVAAAPALYAARLGAASAAAGDAAGVARAARAVAAGVRAAADLLPLMVDGCAPAVFHAQIRPYLSSFSRPVLFEGVYKEGGAPTHHELRGASGAQSAVLPIVDAFLGIGHSGPAELPAYAPAEREQQLRHMPPAHRRLLRMLQASPPASAAALDALETDGGAKAVVAPQVAAELRAARRECTDALAAFRKAHMALVRAFILAPAGFKPGGGERRRRRRRRRAGGHRRLVAARLPVGAPDGYGARREGRARRGGGRYASRAWPEIIYIRSSDPSERRSRPRVVAPRVPRRQQLGAPSRLLDVRRAARRAARLASSRAAEEAATAEEEAAAFAAERSLSLASTVGASAAAAVPAARRLRGGSRQRGQQEQQKHGTAISHDHGPYAAAHRSAAAAAVAAATRRRCWPLERRAERPQCEQLHDANGDRHAAAGEAAAPRVARAASRRCARRSSR